MKNSLLILSLLMLSSFQVSVLSFTDNHVMKAAEGQLSVFTSKIKPGDASINGFRQEDDMELLTVEKPYRLIEFNNDFYDNDVIAEDKNYINIRNTWAVPIASKGLNRTVLTMMGNASNYKAVAMGDTSLARELQPVSRGFNDSDEYYLLRIPMLHADFFVHEANYSFSDAEFIPLLSATVAIKSISKSFNPSYSLNEIQTMVKNELLRREKERPATTNLSSKKTTATAAPVKPVAPKKKTMAVTTTTVTTTTKKTEVKK